MYGPVMDLHQGKTTFFRERRKIYFISFLLLAILLGIIWWWRFYFYPFETTEDAAIQSTDISVSPTISGQIVQMFVQEGSVVQKGDLLFAVDDVLLSFQREKAVAAISHAKDEIFVQEIRNALAQDDYGRAKTEFEAGAISKELFVQAEKNAEMACATLSSIQSLVDVEVANLGMIEKQIEMSHVKAPTSGVVAKAWHVAGDVIQAGQTTLTLIDLAQVWVDAKIEETKISSIRIGNPVYLTLDAYPGLTLIGKVSVIGAAAASQFALIPASNSSGNFTKVTQRVPLKIEFNIPKGEKSLYLRPGMSVKAKIRAR
jgi:membrane fusion protein, multidrug efflux system